MLLSLLPLKMPPSRVMVPPRIETRPSKPTSRLGDSVVGKARSGNTTAASLW
jgi:hypothetical protein